MHTVQFLDNRWVVTFDGPSSWRIIAFAETVDQAAYLASWLNGGDFNVNLANVEWVCK